MAVMKFITKNAPSCPFGGKYTDDRALQSVTQYICNLEKEPLIGGWAVDPNHAIYEMELLSRLYHKNSGIRLRHWTVDFLDSDLRRLEQCMGCDKVLAVYRLGYELTAYFADRYQVVFSVHTDKALPHLHAMMNSVSYIDGSKYSGSKVEYYAYERYAKEVVRQYGFYIHMVTDHAADKYYHAH